MRYETAEEILSQLIATDRDMSLVCRDGKAVITDSPLDNDKVLSTLLGEQTAEITEKRRACV